MSAGRTGAGSETALSVIVTVVEGGEALRGVLAALRHQDDPPAMEVIVPLDESVDGLAALVAEFPGARSLRLGELPTQHPASSPAGQHELYDRRRAAGLAAATGDLVAIVEDRGHPAPDWARTAARLHRAHPAGVIGGAIEPAPCGLLNWAFWVCDFSRYGLPFPEGPVDWVSDVNVVYKRAALERTRHLWQERYHEPVVHWELRRQGDRLLLSPDLVVLHRREPVRLLPLLPERFGWGRLFGALRGRALSPSGRLARVVVAPVIPFVLLLRHARAMVRRGQGARFIRAIPALLVMLSAWTAGETWGIATGRG